MPNEEKLKKQIHEANVSVHRTEAQYYEQLHPEVYSKHEQKRINSQLKTIDRMVEDNGKKALDFGAGTGNLTGKLLKLGYSVVANDISPEMCQILQEKFRTQLNNGMLTVVNEPIENLAFEEGTFDVVAGYSVLHHLPDYVDALVCLCSFLHKGGVIYLDHEASPYYWRGEANPVTGLVKDLYFHSNPIINSIYFGLTGLKVPTIDYKLSDYWHKKEHSINHKKIAAVFKQRNFQYAERTDYYETATWIPNPLSIGYRLLCKPEMSSWIAKK
jgi:ubiquinone/menaquinone biosynthesis C-methylase UbiE